MRRDAAPTPPTPDTRHPTPGRAWNASLIGGLVLLVLWIILAFLAPVGAGWVHLLMAAGVILLIRRVVTGPDAW